MSLLKKTRGITNIQLRNFTLWKSLVEAWMRDHIVITYYPEKACE